METGIQPVMPMGNGGFGGDNGFMFLFAILALMWGSNGFFGGNNGLGYRPATAEDVNNGFNFNDLQNQNRDILNAISAGTAQSVATTNQVYHDTVAALNDKYSELARDIAGLAVGQANSLAKQNECCCNTLRAIDSVKFEDAQNTALINATTTAQTQKILDALAQNKIEALQNRVNQLELQSAVAGVVKYPTSMTYAYNSNPFCSCNGCGYNNI